MIAIVKISSIRWISTFILCLLSLHCTRAQAEQEGSPRVIHFPKNRPVGFVFVGRLRPIDPFWWQGWQPVAPARGDVQVPTDKDVRLSVSADASRDISWLAALRPEDIQVLSFGGEAKKNIDDAALVHLRKLTGLKLLNLDGSQIRGPGLEHLWGLPLLQTLMLRRTGLSDDGLKYLGGLRSPRMLYLSDTKLSDNGLVHLAGLHKLESLILYRCNITGKGFSHLTEL